MPTSARCFAWAASTLMLAAVAMGQGGMVSPARPADRNIVLDVVVTHKSEAAVAGLVQDDFAVFDNGAARALTSFRAVSGKEAPVQLILLVDGVNVGFEAVAQERVQIDKFLRVNGGHLEHPTTLAMFTDTKTEIEGSFSTDGNALSADLDKYAVGLRTIRRSAGYYGAEDRLRLSLNALSQLIAREGATPGRKVILWISPGWPLLSGPGTELDRKQQSQIFADVVRISNQMRQGRITLYNVDPLGMGDAGALRNFYYKEFVKGATKASDVSVGSLGLQVLAEQSGGLSLNSSNDTAGELKRCVADLDAFYEISFEAAPAERADEYHHVEIKLKEPELTARSRQGYYTRP